MPTMAAKKRTRNSLSVALFYKESPAKTHGCIRLAERGLEMPSCTYPKCGKAHDGEHCLSLVHVQLSPPESLLKCKHAWQDQTANLEFSTPFLANVHTLSCDFFVVGRTVRPPQNFKSSFSPICPSHAIPHPIPTWRSAKRNPKPKPERKEVAVFYLKKNHPERE